MPPFFSIIIPTYNRADFLPETIKSVTGQTYADWECIVVDDGSTDHTKDVIEGFNDKRIKYFWKNHEERSIARNYGIDRAKGEYICFLDSDDYYKNDHLDVLFKHINNVNNKRALFYTGMERNAEGKTELLPMYDPKKFKHPVEFVLKHFLFINSVCVHREIFSKFRFPENFHIWEDTHLWLRVVANYPFYQIDKLTTGWKIHSGGSVSENFSKVKIENLKMYMECITDLENNHFDELNGLISKKAVSNYKYGKYKLLMRTAANNHQYVVFVRCFFLGFRYFGPEKVFKSAVSCLLTWS